MGRGRSARALQLVYTLAGERFSGVKASMRRGNIWDGFFEPDERGRRNGPQGGRKARGGVLARTLSCGSRAVRLRGARGNRGDPRPRPEASTRAGELRSEFVHGFVHGGSLDFGLAICNYKKSRVQGLRI